VSEFIKDFRIKNPQYNDMADDQLVTALHTKYYSDIPIEQFNQKIGFQSLPGALDVTPVQAYVAPIEQDNSPFQVNSLLEQDNYLQPNQQIDAYTGAASKPIEQKSMIELIGDKLSEIGGGIASGVEGAYPQAKLQVAGLMQRGEPMTAEQFEQKKNNIGMGMFNTYDDYLKFDQVNRPLSNLLADKGKQIATDTRTDLKPSQFEKGSPGYYSEAIAGSVVNMLPTLGVSLVGRRPDIGLGIMLAQSKGGAYESGRLEGLTPQEADTYSSMIAAAEAIPSAIPVMALLKPTGKILTDMATAGIAEAGQEGLTQAIQAGIDKGYIKPDMTMAEAIDRITEGAIIGAGAGATMSVATSKFADSMNEREKQKLIETQLEAEFDKSLPDANQAELDAMSPDKAQIKSTQANINQQNQTLEAKRQTPEMVVTANIEPQEIDKAKPAQQEPVDFTPPAKEAEKPTKQQVTGKQVVEAPIDEITISKDVPQFKEGANVKGVVEPLGGKFERTGVAPIQIWVREDGRKEVISGRHRLDLAERSGEKSIPAQYHYEAEGFGADQAAVLDAMLNIREGQGKVKDYVDFIKATKPRKAEAESQGILARQTGKRAFTIATEGSDALIASHRNDQLTDEAATRIAEAAPKSEKLQAVGIKAIQEGKTIAVAENMVKAVKYMASESSQDSGDLFGFDDSAMVEAEKLAKAAAKKQAEIQKTLSAVQGAAKNPALAAKEGVDVKDPEAVKARIKALHDEKREWSNWHTNPALVSELKGSDFNLSQETESQRASREKSEAEASKTIEAEAKQSSDMFEADKQVDDFTLTGSDRSADVAAASGQTDIFSQPEVKPEPKSKKLTPEEREAFMDSLEETQAMIAEAGKRDKTNPRYKSYLDSLEEGSEPSNPDYMAFIVKMGKEYRKSKGLRSDAEIGLDKGFTDFIASATEKTRTVTQEDVSDQVLDSFETAEQARKWLANNAKDPVFRELAESLTNLIPSDIEFTHSKEEATSSGRVKGRYTYKEASGNVIDNRVIIYPKGKNESTLTHELIHAATSYTIRNPENDTQKKAIKDIEDLIVHINARQYLFAEGITTEERNSLRSGLGNVDEFVTHSLTHPAFQRALMKIKLPNDNETVFTRLAKAIKSMLGIKMSDGYFERAIAASSKLIEVTPGREKTKLETEKSTFPIAKADPDAAEVIGGNEKTDRKITSATYERAKKRTEKSVEGFVSGSGSGGNIPVKYKYAEHPLAAFDQFKASIRNQTATADEIKSSAKELVDNKDSVIAAMSERAFTKAMLQEITRSPRSDLKKPQMVKQAFESMLSSHVMADATFTIFGGSKSYEEQILEKVNNQTQADVDKNYEKQREYRAERAKQKETFVKSLTNPETLPELKEFIRVRGKDKMTAEQLKTYDEFVAESMREEGTPVIVKGEAEAIKTERAQTKHTKTGDDLFVVKMVGRVEKDHFRELSAKAKQLGGYYSSFAKGEAIPGFQFKTTEAADQFEQLLNGADVDKSNFQEAKAEVKQAKNADKLLDMAQKLEDKANEEINRPRQANTARRASMAAGGIERAEKQLALAKTVRNIAIKLQEGTTVHLGKLSQVTQLEELISIQNRAIPSTMYEHGSFDGYSINRPLKDGVTVEDYINLVELPVIELDKGIVGRIAESLKGKKGYARLAAELSRLPQGKREHLYKLTTEQSEKILAANKAGLIDTHLSWLPDQVSTLSRLNKLGITTGEQLRAAIRELDSMRVAKRQADPIKKLERDLVGKKIEGFFPTPTELVDQMIDYADIQEGHEVLEPSAGKGNIADQIKVSAPNATLDVVEYNASLAALLEAKGYNVVGNDFLQYKGKQYDRIVMNPPFENFQDIDHVKHAYDLLKPGGKLVAIMGAGVKNSRSKAVEFRSWLDDMGSYIEDLPEGSFKNAERSTGVNTVMVTIEKNDDNTLSYKTTDSKVSKPSKTGERIFNAPGHNYIGMFRSSGVPLRQEAVTIEGRTIRVPDKPQRIEPIMSKLIEITGRRIYFGKLKGKSQQGFYRPNVGEIRTRRKNDIEVLAHEMAHYLDVYSNVTLPNFQRLYKEARYNNEVKALSYTDATPRLQQIEGFAEFVRLWLTNSNEAQLRAPEFYNAFNELLARDKKLSSKMRDMQELMHKFYFQGADKLGQALIGKDLSFGHRFNEWKYRRDSRIRQQSIDRFHAARKVEQELTRKIGTVGESAWKQLRIANGGAEGISDYILNYGTVQFDEAGDLKPSGASLHQVLEPVKTITVKPEHKGTQKIDLLMRYFVGRRALELHRQGRENLIPKETAKEWARLGSDYPVFETIQKEYQAFNDRMMDFYEEAGMITAEGRAIMQSMNKDYVPFNRIRDQLAGGKGGKGAGFQKLKGGTANLNDILVNIQDGIVANVQAALTNRAKQRLYQYISNHKDGAIFATKISTDSKPVQVYADDMQAKIKEVLENNGIQFEGDLDLASKDLLTFWQHGVAPKLNESGNIVDSVIINGKPKYYEVQDPLLQEMLVAMNPESYSSFMNVMFGVKNFFTRSITLGIEFTGANLVRDTVGATFLSKNHFIPFVSSFQGMYSFFAKDKYYQDFIRSGGGHSGRLEGATRDSQARRRVKLDEFGVMTGPERLLSTIDNLASAFEYGTRIGEFRLSKKSGKSDMDAGFEAREISTDFSVHGANHFLTGYIRTVPFLNAMVQSQDRVYREALVSKKYNGNPTGMAMKAMLGITLPTLLLYLVNKDDEDYKEIPDYEKRTNWHIKTGEGQFVKIPRPYDVGFVYATMPELFFKYVEDDKGKEFAEGMIWTMTQMYGIDGVPAAMTGWWDIVRNKKWTGAPVIPQALADVEAPEQYSSNTSETFVRMGEALNLSPIKAEHMFKAYTGYLGGYLLAGTDHLLWNKDEFGEKPESKLSENVFLRRFLTPEVRPATANMEKFFELKEKSDKIVSTFKQTIDVRRAIKGQNGEGKFKDDSFYGLSGKEKAVLFALNDSMNDLIKIMYGKEGIKTAELQIKYDKTLTGKEKREKMDKLWLTRNDAFSKYYNQANQALQKAKREANQEK